MGGGGGGGVPPPPQEVVMYQYPSLSDSEPTNVEPEPVCENPECTHPAELAGMCGECFDEQMEVYYQTA